ncbi:MAG TPA: hypothetical protein VFJ30_00730 [Phycisphaerae bacterium]|nr:hypothetical protein [Phycisphaerae bacterium]
MADESLIPQDRPYGDRQTTRELMPLAGVSPAGLRQTPAAANPAMPSAAGAPADFLTARAPSRPVNWTPPDPRAQLANLAEMSPNLYVRAVLKRMLEEPGGP